MSIPEEKTSMSITSLVKECFLTASSHGIPKIAKSEFLLLKIMWTIFFCTSFCFCIYFMVQTTQSFLKNPITTTIEVIQEVPALFPAVSVCNLNPYDSDDSYVDNYLYNIHRINTIHVEPVTVQTRYFKTLSGNITNLSDEIKKRLTVKLENMIVSASFNGYPLNITKEFIRHHDFFHGSCYRFNANMSKLNYVSMVGARYGLQMEIYIGKEDSSLPYSSERGAIIFVSNNSHSSPRDEGILASPGKKTNIRIYRKYHERLTKPFSNCVKDLTRENPRKSALMNQLFDELGHNVYLRRICFRQCLQRLLISTCNCSNPELTFSKINRCNINNLRCEQRVYREFNNNPRIHCEHDCPPECSYFTYESSVSESEYLTQGYWNYMKQHFQTKNDTELGRRISSIKSLTGARKSMLSVSIYYDELSYTFTSEKPYWSFDLLLSNYGGQLGLFIGASLLSCGEIFEFIFRILVYVLEKSLGKRKTNAF